MQKKLQAGGKKRVLQGVMQDKNALMSAGTPTCVAWQTVGEIKVNGAAAARFNFTFAQDGAVEDIAWPASGVTLRTEGPSVHDIHDAVSPISQAF